MRGSRSGEICPICLYERGQLSNRVMSEIIGFLFSVWASLVAVQREISAELAQVLRIYAATGEWRTLATFLPWSIVFGAAHAKSLRDRGSVWQA